MANPFTQDGHKVVFSLAKDTVVVDRVDCPYDNGVSGVCNKNGRCVVRRFIYLFGTECCLGSTTIDGPVEIAWYPVFGESDLDPEVGAVFFTPVNDIEYQDAVAADQFDSLASS